MSRNTPSFFVTASKIHLNTRVTLKCKVQHSTKVSLRLLLTAKKRKENNHMKMCKKMSLQAVTISLLSALIYIMKSILRQVN